MTLGKNNTLLSNSNQKYHFLTKLTEFHCTNIETISAKILGIGAYAFSHWYSKRLWCVLYIVYIFLSSYY